METNKYLDQEGLSQLWNLIVSYSNDKIFIGTRAEYEAKNAENAFATGCLIILVDEIDNENSDEGGENNI
jgi:hypothetical protein